MPGVNVFAPQGWHKPWPFGLYLFGAGYFVLSFVAIFTGTLVGRGGKIHRAEGPIGFWIVLVLQLGVGVFLMRRALAM